MLPTLEFRSNNRVYILDMCCIHVFVAFADKIFSFSCLTILRAFYVYCCKTVVFSIRIPRIKYAVSIVKWLGNMVHLLHFNYILLPRHIFTLFLSTFFLVSQLINYLLSYLYFYNFFLKWKSYLRKTFVLYFSEWIIFINSLAFWRNVSFSVVAIFDVFSLLPI